MKNRIGIVLHIITALLLAATSAQAEDKGIWSCRYVVKDDQVTNATDGAKCIKEQSDLIKGLRAANTLAWKIAGSPAEFLRLANLSDLRRDERLGVRAAGMYWDLRSKLSGDSDDYDSGRDAFAGIRARFADPAALEKFYLENKAFIATAIKAASIIGALDIVYSDALPILSKPLDLALASAGGRWYGAMCWRPDQEGDDAKLCKELAWFGEKFRQTYGIEISPNPVWVLGFLYRRHLEGGTKLVDAYKNVAATLVLELGIGQKTGAAKTR